MSALLLGHQRVVFVGLLFATEPMAAARARPPGRSCPMPGRSRSTTRRSTCRSSPTASTATTPSSSSLTSGWSSSWPPLDPDRAGDVARDRQPFQVVRRLFGNRQAARSIHFLGLLGFLGFLAVHVTMVVVTGLARNMDHIVIGTDDRNPVGLILGCVGIAVMIVACVAANWFSWHRPRCLQTPSQRLVQGLIGRVLDPWRPGPSTPGGISPYLLAQRQAADLQRVDEPGRRRLRGLPAPGPRPGGEAGRALDRRAQALGKQEQITMHHCIQGWSGIAAVGRRAARQARRAGPAPSPRRPGLVFHSFGEGLHGGEYYDTQSHARRAPPPEHPRLRDERRAPRPGLRRPAPAPRRESARLQDGQVDQGRSSSSPVRRAIGKGYGGKNEDDEYYDLVPNI